MKEVSAAFVRAQKKFSPALKKSTNPHFKSKYASLDACVDAVIDALNGEGIALLQKPHQVDSGVGIETLFIHESGEILSGGFLCLPAIKHDPQAYGSALTYARRYGLMAACGIAPEDDDGTLASKAMSMKITPEQVTAINDLIDQTETKEADFLKWLGEKGGIEIKSVNDIPQEAYEPAVKALKKKVKPA